MKRYVVGLWRETFDVVAANEAEARIEAIQALVESSDLLVVTEADETACATGRGAPAAPTQKQEPGV